MTPLPRPDSWDLVKVLALLAIALGALCLRQRETIARLSARPAVEAKVDKSTKTETHKGKVRVVEKFVTVPGKCDPVVIERIVETDPEISTTETHRVSEKVETPPPTLPAARTRYVGLTLDPLLRAPRAARAGLTVFGLADVGASYDWRYEAVGVDVGLRF